MKGRPMSRVFGADPVRYGELDGLTDELLASITEQVFGAGVHQHDLTLRVDQDDAGRRSFHDQSEPVLRLLALGDIDARTDVAEELAICVTTRRSTIDNPTL